MNQYNSSATQRQADASQFTRLAKLAFASVIPMTAVRH